MPALGPDLPCPRDAHDRRVRLRRTLVAVRDPWHPGSKALPDGGVLALVRGDRRDLRAILRVVERFLVPFHRLHEVRHGSRPEEACDPDDEAHPRAGAAGGGDIDTVLPQSRRPDLRMAALVGRDGAEGACPLGVALDLAQALVEDDRIALELEVGQAPFASLRVELG